MGSALDNLQNSGQPCPGRACPSVRRIDRYNVNLPVANPAGRLALVDARVRDYIVDLELSAAQREGRGEIMSTPRVITANQQEAIIEQGVGDSVPGGGIQRRDHDRSSRKRCWR